MREASAGGLHVSGLIVFPADAMFSPRKAKMLTSRGTSDIFAFFFTLHGGEGAYGMAAKTGGITQDRISQLANNITVRLRESISDIQSVNDDIHVLSINAKILAAKSGSSGKAFAVVADSVRGMVGRTQGITDSLQTSVEATVSELMEINSYLGTKVRAERLSQVAENLIDVVDRNLYERSCDVRWWATEAAVTAALESPGAETVSRCVGRLALILDSYTVYLDIVVCDLEGKIVANGRPGRFASTGLDVAASEWFSSAVRTSSGNEYGFEGVHRSRLAGGSSALVFSCGVREGGSPDGRLVGVLGIVFNWDGLGAVVVGRAKEMLAAETDRPLHAHIAYRDGTVIASTGSVPEGKIPGSTMESVLSSVRGTIIPADREGGRFIAGYAASRGFETYRTGWYAIIQEEADGERR